MKCTVCDNELRPFAEWVYDCPSCGFSRSTLRPGAGRGVEGLEVLRRQNFAKLITKISAHLDLNEKRCLEVGSAEGWFLEALRGQGAQTVTLEPSDMADDLAAKGYETIKGFFPDDIPTGRSFDLIAFNDVFEHLDDPIAAIQSCEEHTADDGIVVINLPSNKGVFYRVAKILYRLGIKNPFERLWQVGLPSPHITYFSPATLRTLAEKNTSLQCLDTFVLPSITRIGLKERIEASYSGLPGLVIYWLLVMAIPLIKILPSDICVLVFKKGKVPGTT
jgi:SAM-dependent methyltransferase